MKIATGRGHLAWFKPLQNTLVAFLFFSTLFFLNIFAVQAEVFSSSNFVDQDPVILSEGGHSTSTNFEIISGTSQNEIGESASVNFGYRSGFFYFPLVTTPVLGATAGDTQVSLTWSAAVGSLGFNVSGYQIGQSTAIAGPFTFTSVGNVLNSTRSGLTNSTPYYFLVRALDIFGTPIVSSSVVVATPVATTAPGGGGAFNSGGGGSNTGPSQPQNGAIELSGITVPGGTVTTMIDGVIVEIITANGGGNFVTLLEEITPGTHVVSLYVTDESGLKSAPSTFIVSIESRKIFQIKDIFLAPTITSDKESITITDTTELTGTSVPNSTITIFIEGKKNLVIETITDAKGQFRVTLPGKGFPVGSYRIYVRSQKKGVTSNTSRAFDLQIGTKTIPREPHAATCPTAADFNSDCRVDLVDFSILLYWFNRFNPPAGIDLNGDGYVNITDFSIMMYYWTG